MTDTTTLGYEPEPSDVEALFGDLCGDLLGVADPLERYSRLTAGQVLYDALVSRIKVERGRALREMAATGATYEQIASVTGLGTKQRISQLIAR